jgi:hypothetical protein
VLRGGYYETSIEDPEKRDGSDGLGVALGNRHSHTDTDRAVHGARLHIIIKPCGVAGSVRSEIEINESYWEK